MSLTNRPKGYDHRRMREDVGKWRIPDQGIKYDQL